MAKNYAQIIVETAATLISTAGFATAVAATDIKAAARSLEGDLHGYTQSKITNDLADEIKKRNHGAGISGSL